MDNFERITILAARLFYPEIPLNDLLRSVDNPMFFDELADRMQETIDGIEEDYYSKELGMKEQFDSLADRLQETINSIEEELLKQKEEEVT